MIATVMGWLTGKMVGPVMSGLATLLLIVVVVQNGQIHGWPLIGGGLKAEIASLQAQLAARDMADAKARAAALTARQAQAEAAQVAARDATAGDRAIRTQIQTVIREVPKRVDAKADAVCVLDWGAVRLLDAAASGADPAAAAALIAPGQPDDAASDVKLSAAVALLATDLGIARRNASQLAGLQKAVAP